MVTNNIILTTLENTECKCDKITNLTLLIISISGIIFGISSLFIYDSFTGCGYIGTGVFAGSTLITIKKMRISETIANSVNILSEENDNLAENNSKLEDNLVQLEINSKSLNHDIHILKNTIGLIGENSDELFNKLKNVHLNLQEENDRHSVLIKSQTSLLLMNIINHYDKNSNFKLDYSEIEYAKQTLLNTLPGITWTQLESKIQNNELRLESILQLIN